MSAGTNLLRLILWDIRLQARERVYFFTAFTTAAFAVVILLLPAGTSDAVVTGILFLDPAIVGVSFVGSIILMERSQNTLAALAVSPAEPRDYVLAKIVTLTGLTFAGGMFLAGIAYHPISWDRALRFIVAMGFTGTLGVLVGLVVIAKSSSMNHFIARLFPISLVAYLPGFAHFGVVDGIWKWLLFGANPGHAMLRALLWAADPAHVTRADMVYAFGYMGVLIAIFFRWSLAIYGDDLVRVSG
jgi:fluoroquinolone transport system permease protein